MIALVVTRADRVRRPRRRPVDRPARARHRADLPLEPRHQLRGRRARAFSAALLALLVVQYHWSYLAGRHRRRSWPVAPSRLQSSSPSSRRLFRAPRVIVLVATIGIAQLALAAQTALPQHRRRRSTRRTRPRSPAPGRSPASRSAGPELARPDRGPAHHPRADAVPDSHRHRQGGTRRGREPRSGAPVGDQPEDALHASSGRSAACCRPCRSSSSPAPPAASSD